MSDPMQSGEMNAPGMAFLLLAASMMKQHRTMAVVGSFAEASRAFATGVLGEETARDFFERCIIDAPEWTEDAEWLDQLMKLVGDDAD